MTSELEHPARDHQVHLVAGGGEPLVRDAQQVPEEPSGRVCRHDAHADLVGHQHDVVAVPNRLDSHGQPSLELGQPGLLGRLPTVEVVDHRGQPRAEAVDERRAALASLDAGAAVIHAHNANIRLVGRPAADDYLAAWRRILADRPDVLWYPTGVAAADLPSRLHHLELLAEELPMMM